MMMTPGTIPIVSSRNRAALLVLLGAALLAACDTGITGTAAENQAPETTLSVRDTSLVDNLEGADRLSSTVLVSWAGTDADGYVAAFELRFFVDEDRSAYYDGGQPNEQGWTRTTRRDTLVLLPIKPGNSIANVTFQVRAFDNEGLRDPTPAETTFPIQNAPPEIKLNEFDLPPDTTFTIASFAWAASDPEGEANLARIEVSLNDSTTFTPLPPDVEFITLVGDADRSDTAPAETQARVYTGRAFQPTDTYVPGLRLDAENTVYLRAVDQTDTSSVMQRYTWYVKKPRAKVLYVNDYRKATNPTIQRFHLDLLRDYLPLGEPVDVWDLSQPFVTGNEGNAPRSDALPPAAAPTLQQTLALYDYIYWVSTAATNRVQGNNLPLAVSVMDVFFEQGGRLMVHTPVSLPDDPEANLENPALVVLPLTDLIIFPDSLRRLSLPPEAALTPAAPLPGTGATLPALEVQGNIVGPLPYQAESANIIPLYRADFRYRTRDNSQGLWTGPATVASISADQRVALFALPLLNETTGEPLLTGTDGDPAVARQAVEATLESLGFPER